VWKDLDENNHLWQVATSCNFVMSKNFS